MRKREILERYFKWLSKIVCSGNDGSYENYESLLLTLHAKPFICTLDKDENRIEDAEELRLRFVEENDLNYRALDILNMDCSVFEIMVALADRGSTLITSSYDEMEIGSLFWQMIFNMGLLECTDQNWDPAYVDSVIDNFIQRRYKRNGEGGLFYIEGNNRDMRKIEIWHQMCMYLDSILDPTLY